MPSWRRTAVPGMSVAVRATGAAEHGKRCATGGPVRTDDDRQLRTHEAGCASGLLPAHPDMDPVEAADPHEVVIAGRRDGRYLVEDRPGRIDGIAADVLVTAWAWHREGRFRLQSIVAVPEHPDLPAAVRAALPLTVDHLTGPVLGNSVDVNMGFSGMARLATELRDVRTKAGRVRRFPDDASLRYAVDRLRDCLTTTYTAPAGTRTLYAEFLDWAGEVLDAPRPRPRGCTLRRAAEHWTTIAKTTPRFRRTGRAIRRDR